MNFSKTQRRYYSFSLINNKNAHTVSDVESLLNLLEKIKLELGHQIVPSIRNKQYNWPLNTPNIYKSVNGYVQLYNKIVSIKALCAFSFIFKIEFNLNSNIDDIILILKNIEDESLLGILKILNKIKSNSTNKKTELITLKFYYYKAYSINHTKPLSCINREAIKNNELWLPILEEAGKSMSDIIMHTWAVHLISRSSGRFTPGVDAKAFRIIPTYKGDNSKKASNATNSLTKKLKYLLSTIKGKTDQAINRKGKCNLNKRELLRISLKSKTNQRVRNKIKRLQNDIINNPIKFLQGLHMRNSKHNNKLKWELRDSLKRNKIFNYESKETLQTYVQKKKGKPKFLRLLTLKDKTLQMLLKIIMEPYMEPLGDSVSFGFRPRRNLHQVTSHLHNLLAWKSFSHSKVLSKGKLVYSPLKQNAKIFCERPDLKKSLIMDRVEELAKEKTKATVVEIYQPSKKASKVTVQNKFFKGAT